MPNSFVAPSPIIALRISFARVKQISEPYGLEREGGDGVSVLTTRITGHLQLTTVMTTPMATVNVNQIIEHPHYREPITNRHAKVSLIRNIKFTASRWYI